MFRRTAEQLVDFAVMGEAFAHAILGLDQPSVGLLNVGTEEQKGNDAVKGAAEILRAATKRLPMAFHGFVEGNDIAEGTVDVVVTDGFTGNIALKTAEGTAKLVGQFLRRSLKRSLLGQIGAFIASGALDALRRRLDPRAANGGIFLGLKGVVVKSHGGTDAIGFASALDMAITMAKADINTRITADRASDRARWRRMIRSRVIGCGAFLPERSSPMTIWPRSSTPPTIGSASAPAFASAASSAKARRPLTWRWRPRAPLLVDAGMDAGEIDMIICCTTTPDETFPATATMVQARLGMTRGAAFDVQAVCSGFIYGLSVADNFIRGGQANTVLLIGAESMSRLLDWTDRTTCVLFGDGAGAVVLQGYEGTGDNVRPGRAQHQTLFRRASARHALCRWRSVFHPARRGICACRARKSSATPWPTSLRRSPPRRMPRDLRSPISTGSCPTRPTSASWTAPRASWASRLRR